ncbi:MAG: carboxy-S-adenosyl-L-methionine synthase CmoA [Campylobacteraceae bacterium]|jgi:tRNA (cmo5U34)-methyltransferase|nr:carboxy-S-adenosyl-L-methionine synthase CmoA [Campylobacteraceae bacterium]
MKDKIFEHSINKQFEFDESVASVFDDMLSRSIPFYAEVLNLVCELSLKYTHENGAITDLGCSTANTLLLIAKEAKFPLRLKGIDNSEAMCERARRKIKAYGADIEIVEGDILEHAFGTNSVIIANYTFQFIRPPKRVKLAEKIYESLENGGICIFSEKIIYKNKILNKKMIDLYLSFKKNQGYSDFEIAQKREALENVLVPYTENENIDMMKAAGFSEVVSVFKYANFATFLAIKT